MLNDDVVTGETAELFASARAKLARAELHFADFTERAIEWTKKTSGKYNAGVAREDHVEGDLDVLVYRLAESKFPPPREFALIIGDIVVNLRAMLDHVAWELVTRAGAKVNMRQVYFPVCDIEPQFRGDCVVKLSGVPSDQLDVIRRVQPFAVADAHRISPRDAPLAVLNRW